MQDEISAAMAAFSGSAREALNAARRMIEEEAAAAPEIAELEASLKWGQPSFAPTPKTGTPIRLGLTKSGAPALFVHCGTTLIEDWSRIAGPSARVEGNRALILEPDDLESARPFIRRALTFRRRT
ncbi:MAG: DUF1801 domain-containing protein [Pseudomonadota bacterium]